MANLGTPTPRKFMRGARRTPAQILARAPRFRERRSAPAQIAYVPAQLSVWGNDRYGDCVTAEEAFAKACDQPEDFIPDDVVIRWAQAHGVLNGADLGTVLQMMATDGFVVGPQGYKDGVAEVVDYTNETALGQALAYGPVKIAIDANALPSGAGNQQGWYAFGGARYPNTDHCVAICGKGPASYCFSVLGVPVPAGVDPAKPAYLVFTWGTIGVVDFPWLLNTCVEAWVRVPTTVFDPPLPTPTPTPVPPAPTPTPTPVPPGPVPIPPAPGPAGWNVDLLMAIAPGGVAITGTITPPLGATAPPWLIALLKAVCASSALLPPPWNAIAAVACTMIPPAGVPAPTRAAGSSPAPWQGR